jgi:hypothetical protein
MTYTIHITRGDRTHEVYARTRAEADAAYGRALAVNPAAEVKLTQDGAVLLSAGPLTRRA